MIREDGTSTISTYDTGDRVVTQCSESFVHVTVCKDNDMAELRIATGPLIVSFPSKYIGSIADVMRRAMEAACATA